ncbi:MAG: hypothetical protein HOK97_07920 [Deltaproteobacteria bacterium]|nr:hypothetical protein [Deltaproteobacteria bacterium]MBT6489672.1 hypothetical protein [Deltaproteobacteria bacterium]
MMASAFDIAKKQLKIMGVALSIFTAFGSLNTNTASANSAGDNGILIGDARLHPFLDFHTNFVSNPNRASTGGQSDLALTVRPGFNLELTGSGTELFFTTNAGYKHYLGLNDQDNSAVTSNLSRLNVGAALEAKFLKQGSLPLNLKIEFLHDETPRNQTLNQKLTHNMISSNLGFDAKPGGGALKFTLNYKPSIDLYPEADEALTTHRHVASFKTLWKFLPKTATFFETSFDALMYLSDTPVLSVDNTDDTSTTTVVNQDIQFFNVYTGLTGSITEKFRVLLRLGYGQALLTETQLATGESNPAGFLGQVDLKFKSSNNIVIGAGFNRTLSGAALYKYMIDNNIYLSSKATLARRWGFSVKGSVSMLEYGKLSIDSTDTNRSDTMIRVEAVASVAVTDWFVIALVDKVETLITDYSLNGSESPKYFFNDLFLRLSVRY